MISWKCRPPTQQPTATTAPDDWIASYLSGYEPDDISNNGPSSGATVKADLDVYDSSALQWFTWIGIFKALAHNSKRSPDEKLAILCHHLKGDSLDVVSGLGGGEYAYKEALRRLLDTCGR